MLAPSAANAGTTGEITGSVLNLSTGAPVTGAKVTATSPAEAASATTDAHGNFTFVSLIPGTYRVLVERDGFVPTTIANVPVLADNTSRVAATARAALTEIVTMSYHFRVWSQGIGHGTISDVYRYRGSSSDYFSWNSAWQSPLPNVRLIQMTPGITFGAGAPMNR